MKSDTLVHTRLALYRLPPRFSPLGQSFKLM